MVGYGLCGNGLRGGGQPGMDMHDDRAGVVVDDAFVAGLRADRDQIRAFTLKAERMTTATFQRSAQLVHESIVTGLPARSASIRMPSSTAVPMPPNVSCCASSSPPARIE